MGQTWDANPIHDLGNIGSDVWSFTSGPPGDPGRIRQVAKQIESMQGELQGDVTAINEGIDELTSVWRGDGATAFAAAWHATDKSAPAHRLQGSVDGLGTFAQQLLDYADRLEHAQHEHWLQLALMGALLVVDVAQLGLDPLTDAAAIGIGAAVEIGVPVAVAEVATFAIEGAIVNFASDALAQLGADAWDRLAGDGFDASGDHAVALFDGQEAETSAIQGAVSFGLARGGGELLEQSGAGAFGGKLIREALVNPWARTAAVGAFSTATDAAGQLIGTGHVDWEQAALAGGIGGLAGGHAWRAEDVGRVEALGRFYDPSTADPVRFDQLTRDPARGVKVKAGPGGGPDEAKSVMRLEHAGLIDGPVTRSTNPQVDFVDRHSANLDVKSPQDFYTGKGAYTLPGTLKKMKDHVALGKTLIINIDHLSRANARELIMATRNDPALTERVLFSTSR